jgi:hypothetical protein
MRAVLLVGYRACSGCDLLIGEAATGHRARYPCSQQDTNPTKQCVQHEKRTRGPFVECTCEW